MPDIWKMLEIEPTKDVAIIKRAYAALAKKYHPEQYPEEFLNLRNAYEAGMDYASNGKKNKKYLKAATGIYPN